MSPPDSGDISQAELRRWLTRIESQQGQMVTQAVWQMQQQHMQQQITDMRSDFASLRAEMKLESQTKGAQRWQVWMSLLTAGLSFLVAVALLVWSR